MTKVDTQGDGMESSNALSVDRIAKSYGPTQALSELSFSVRRGEVHAILGENGAGKSTLIKILSGATVPDSGQLSVHDRAVHLRRPRDARSAGIATAYQELTLVPQLTVAQNLLLGKEPLSRFGLVTNSVLAAESRRLLAEWGLNSIDPDSIVETLSLGVQQQIELVRAFAQRSDIVLLDEPTAALGTSQVDWLFEQISRVKKRGGTVVFISHRMGEVRTICDHATVLRGGMLAGTFVPADVDDAHVLHLMLGQNVEDVLRPSNAIPVGEPVLAAESLQSGTDLRGVDFELAPGELVGLAALQGHGQHELFMTLFGANRLTGGRILVNGKEVNFRSPRDAIKSGLGISLVPEDRKTEGIMLRMSGLRNVTLPNVRRLSTFGFMRSKREREEARSIFETVNVRLSALDDDVATLSGGNQQKLAIGKWLNTDAQCMLMYDPTRGVDVGTKAEIFSLMHRLSSEGAAILFYSTDIEELLAVSSRVMVLYRGELVANLAGEDLTRRGLLSAMLGQDETQRAFERDPAVGVNS